LLFERIVKKTNINKLNFFRKISQLKENGQILGLNVLF